MEALPPVWADPSRMRQILTNLIDNAIKFTSVGGSVTVAAKLSPEADGFLQFSVTDTGIGISPAHLELVFERLAQVGDEYRTSRAGLGLGLYIARELVVQHGGRIWVESELEQGSTFSFTLPIFSLARLCGHVLTAYNLESGYATLLSVDLAVGAGHDRTDLLPQLRELLARCVHPGRDVLLPWIGDLGADSAGDLNPLITFFIVACTDRSGSSIIGRRIEAELSGLSSASTVTATISSATMDLKALLRHETKVRQITVQFGQWIEDHLQGPEEFRRAA